MHPIALVLICSSRLLLSEFGFFFNRMFCVTSNEYKQDRVMVSASFIKQVTCVEWQQHMLYKCIKGHQSFLNQHSMPLYLWGKDGLTNKKCALDFPMKEGGDKFPIMH